MNPVFLLYAMAKVMWVVIGIVVIGLIWAIPWAWRNLWWGG